MICLVVAWAYSPGLSAGFYFDDFLNIVDNRALRIGDLRASTLESITSGTEGGRFFAMLSFALHYYLGWTEPADFRLVNIAIHLATALVIAGVLTRVLALAGRDQRRDRLLALAVTAVWALHPLQVTAVTYIVQRMTSLAALLFWSALLCYLSGRTPGDDARPWARSTALVASAALWLTGLATKEHVVILPAIIVATEVLLLRSHTSMSKSARLRAVVALGAVAVTLIALRGDQLLSVVRLFSVDLLAPIAEERGGTPLGRLLTEGRVLLTYASLLLFPLWTRLHLFWTVTPSTGLLSPATTGLSWLVIVATLVLALRFRRKHPLVAWGVVCFFLAHLVESTVLPLLLAFEHRMYLPSVFALVPLGVGALHVIDHAGQPLRQNRLVVPGLLALLMAWLALGTYQRNTLWHDTARFYAHQLSLNPDNDQVALNYAVSALAGMIDVPPDDAVRYAEALAQRLANRPPSQERDFRLNSVHSNLALHFINRRSDIDRGLTELLTAFRFGYSPIVTSRLAGFYFYARVEDDRATLDRLAQVGLSGDRAMLQRLEQAYATGVDDWVLVVNLIAANAFVARQTGQPLFARRAMQLIAESRGRYGSEPEKMRELDGLAAGLSDSRPRAPR